MNRIGWSIAIIFTAVFLLYIPILFDEQQDQNVIEGDIELVPNYQAVNLNSRFFNKNGTLSHQVVADKMEHYQSLGFTLFENPVYTIFLDDGQPWQVTASEGTLYENDRIQLEVNVRIRNLRSQEYIKEITTEYIEIDLKDKILRSDQIVTISGLNYAVRSVGMLGNLVTQQYELKEHVRTEFTPQFEDQ